MGFVKYPVLRAKSIIKVESFVVVRFRADFLEKTCSSYLTAIPEVETEK